MLDFYQHIPSYIDPVAFFCGYFAIRWYSLGYLAGFTIFSGLVYWRIKKGEFLIDEQEQLWRNNTEKDLSKVWNFFWDVLLCGFVGMLLGGRLGYVLFYDLDFFWKNPWMIISPFDIKNGDYIGIYGMSYYGALMGVVLFIFIFAKVKWVDFWRIADFLAPAVAAGYFFGRLGNFLNKELIGRPTDFLGGMYFGQDNFLRHPSQLYEALFEGLVLFGLLWLFRNKATFKGQIFFLYLIGYSFFRFILEYFRLPDQQLGLLGGILSLGQVLSLLAILIGTSAYFIFKKRLRML